MHLKRLELFGFKSFADRTHFMFPDGMTSVVGPNGCGKSNVVDAFKWIFGEQSAKGLRGSGMQDVIFSGTQIRKPTGFAEVTVVFDNADRFLDVDFAEVAITRRLYRSGESEYRLNKEKCRLRDIRELLMDTGIGRTSYSILEQGKIDVLLQASRLDRRIIFEEAAGISKYRAKKAETLRALTRVEDNLARLTDIVDEIERRLQRLKSQASRARRYRTLSDRLKELRVRAALEDYKSSREARTTVAFRLWWAQLQVQRLEDLVARLDAKVGDCAGQRDLVSERLREQREKLAGEQVLLERNAQRVEHARSRLEEMAAERERREEEIAETEAAVARVQAQIDAERDQLETSRAEIEAGHELLAERTDQRDDVRRRSDEIQLSVRQRKDELVAILQRRARVQNAIVQLDSELGNITARADRLRGTVGQSTERLAAQKEAVVQEEAQLAEHEVALAGIEEERARVEAQLDELAERGAAVEQTLEARLSELHQKSSRFELLETLEANLEGVSRGVRDLLGREEELAHLGGVEGLLATLLKVDRQYARAVEAALGTRAQAIVVRSHDGAVGLLDVARREEVGAVEILPLDRVDSVRGVLARRQRAGARPVGSGLGALRRAVTAPPHLGDLLDRLLADTVVVDDLDAAFNLARNGTGGLRVVTLRGEVIEPWGSVRTSGEADLGLISRRSEMDELAVSVSELQEEERRLRSELSDVRNAAREQRAEVDELAQVAGERASQMAETAEKLRQMAREVDRLQREIAVGEGELQQLEEQLTRARTERDAREQVQAEIEVERERCESTILAEEASAEQLLASTQSAEESLTQARLELAQAERREEGLRELVRRQEAALAEKTEALAGLHTQLEASAARREATFAEIAALEADAANSEERVAALRSLVDADEAADRELAGREQSLRQEVDLLRKEVTRVGEQRESAQLRDQEERHRRNTILERLDEDYGIDLRALLEWEDHVLEQQAILEQQRAALESAADDSKADGTTVAGAAGEGESTGGDSAKKHPAESDAAAPAAVEAPTLTLDQDAPVEVVWLVPDPSWDRAAAREEIREIQGKLRRMGSVNLEALEELEEVEERYTFQKAQRDDLVESEASLRAIIEEINTTSREMFLAAFTEVQRHFSDLFRKCFGGGRAELHLEEGVDVLEAGIEIVARPPGKKISSLSLMSGGEKTMTTLALLFAIFRARPCPFCILDEVDAPLDEANVGRFVVLLRDFSRDTQFVVVTHNKATMAEANTLYGVTMQERGVSTRVAVELETFDADQMEAEAARVSSN